MSRTVCYQPFHLDHQARFSAPATHIAKLLGHRAKNIEGKRIDTFVSREDGPVFLETLLNAYRGLKTKKICIDMIAQNNKLIEVDIRLTPEAYDRHGAVTSVKGDICRCRQRASC